MAFHLMLTTSPLVFPDELSYADMQNAKLHKTDTDYMTFKERLNSVLHNTWRREKIEWAIAQLRAKFPDFKKFKDIRLPQAIIKSAKDIVIDTTLQRDVDFLHLINIITNFNPLVIQALCVYRPTDGIDKVLGMLQPIPNDVLSLWEGQHTALALYAIATMLLGMEDDADILFPCVIGADASRAEMREAFDILSSDGRKPFETCDYHRSYVMAYRVDGDTTKNRNVAAHLKQEALETAGLFVTSKDNDDTDQEGAFSNLAEFGKDFSVPVHRAFARMVCELDGGDKVTRTVQGKISPHLYYYLERCEELNIEFTDLFFKETAKALNMGYKKGYTGTALHRLAKIAAQNSYARVQNTSEPDYHYEYKVHDICFMIAQISHFISNKDLVPVPGSKYGRFTVDPTDCDE